MLDSGFVKICSDVKILTLSYGMCSMNLQLFCFETQCVHSLLGQINGYKNVREILIEQIIIDKQEFQVALRTFLMIFSNVWSPNIKTA